VEKDSTLPIRSTNFLRSWSLPALLLAAVLCMSILLGSAGGANADCKSVRWSCRATTIIDYQSVFRSMPTVNRPPNLVACHLAQRIFFSIEQSRGR